MNNIQTEILSDIRSARKSINVAVSWLTDSLLIKELLVASQRGVDVKISISSNKISILRFELFLKLIENGAIVNKEGSEEPEQGGFMHYKFYIIDDSLAKSGSYNWSVKASTNREALDVVSVVKKINEFNECYKKSVNFFHDIVDPELGRAEVQLKVNEQKDSLTPEKLAAYNKIKIYLKEQETINQREIEELKNYKSINFKHVMVTFLAKEGTNLLKLSGQFNSNGQSARRSLSLA